jgi:site-specific DNA-methyltransferase (adenine-specific)
VKPYYEHGGITIYHGDCREILPSLAYARAELVTDPPYGIGWQTDYTSLRDGKNGEKGYGYMRKKHDPIVGDSEPFDPTHLLSFDRAVIWGANNFSDKLPRGSWLVWDKRADNGHALLADAEVAWKSTGSGVFIFDYCWHGFARPSEPGTRDAGGRCITFHPTQKPVALMRWSIKKLGAKGTIVDPYCGSGPTLIAAKNLGLEAIGIEIEEKYCEIAAKRLSQEVFDFTREVTTENDGGRVGPPKDANHSGGNL